MTDPLWTMLADPDMAGLFEITGEIEVIPGEPEPDVEQED